MEERQLVRCEVYSGKTSERTRDTAALEDVRCTGGVFGLEFPAQQCKIGSSNRWKNDVMQHEGGRGDSGRGEDGTAGFGARARPRADASAVRLQPEDLHQAGLGRLPLRSAPVRLTQHLACILVHVV